MRMNDSFELYIKEKQKIVEKELSLLFNNKGKYTKNLYKAMQYSTMAGGKRIRPILFIMIYEILSKRKSVKPVMPIALSIEMVHTYSLIHDDLPSIDNDDIRRGKPTLHKKYNEATAILAGDALFAYAIQCFLSANIKEYLLNKALRYFLYTIGPDGMVGGQFVDTQINDYKKDVNTLRFIHEKKTAYMINSCFVLPAIILSKQKDIILLESIGKNAGILFQIIDDLLDTLSTTEVLGKSVKKDIKQNKLTYITFFGIKKTKELAKKQYIKTLKLIKELNYDTFLLEQMINLFYKRIK